MHALLPEIFLQHAIGLDVLNRFAESAAGGSNNYPPHNIEQLDDDTYRLTLAVAGFRLEDLNATLHDGILTVEGKVSHDQEAPSTTRYLHRGIGLRSFSRDFKLAEHVEVTGTSHEQGLLVFDLRRRTPDNLKPRRLLIRST